MSEITGYVILELEKAEEKPELITVNGDQFYVEESDSGQDRDDMERSTRYLFVAVCDDFELHLSVNIHGNSITHYKLSIEVTDFDKIKEVRIVEDNLDISNLLT